MVVVGSALLVLAVAIILAYRYWRGRNSRVVDSAVGEKVESGQQIALAVPVKDVCGTGSCQIMFLKD